MPQYRISDTLLIDTNMILSQEDVDAIKGEEDNGTFVPERWNVHAVEYSGKVVAETVTIPRTEYEALKEMEAECLQQRALVEEMKVARLQADVAAGTAISVEDQAALDAAAAAALVDATPADPANPIPPDPANPIPPVSSDKVSAAPDRP